MVKTAAGNNQKRAAIPAFVGIAVALLLYATFHWWGFFVLFPWIGFSISIGILIDSRLPSKRKGLGRRIALLLTLPALLLFVPIANNENLQLEGIVLLLSIGFFGKGVVHYAVAKLFGPLIWGRGFCSWGCWTAAILEWLPVNPAGRVPGQLKRLRYLSLALSIGLPLLLIIGFGFDVRHQYLRKQEMLWMFAGNALYYLLAIPLAFWFKDQRAFCKILCPVSLVMKIPATFSRMRIRPTATACVQCGLCNKVCPMEVAVMAAIAAGNSVRDTECIYCGTCRNRCPVGAIR
jgi:ferredoxin-type protein NapH